MFIHHHDHHHQTLVSTILENYMSYVAGSNPWYIHGMLFSQTSCLDCHSFMLAVTDLMQLSGSGPIVKTGKVEGLLSNVGKRKNKERKEKKKKTKKLDESLILIDIFFIARY